MTDKLRFIELRNLISLALPFGTLVKLIENSKLVEYNKLVFP